MRYSPLLLLLSVACAPAPPPPAPLPPAALHDPSCPADFDSTVALVSRDYAGYLENAARRPVGLAALTDSVRAETTGAPGEEACPRAILRWVESFGDPHLTIYGRPTAATARRGGARGGAPPGRGLSLRFPDDSTAVLRLPTFDLRRRAAIDSLIAEHRVRLLGVPYLLIDVRGNGGGWSGSYASVLPLLYAGPIRVRGIEIWASAGNLAAMRVSLGAEGVPAELTEQIRVVLPKMEMDAGSFVPLQEDADIRLDTIYPLPRTVAVLVDRGCASACEQFVLEASQSRKVTVLGVENTRGALDYLNVRTVPLASGVRTLRFPISRLSGLPTDAVNPAGIAPDLLVPRDVADQVEFARRYLASRTAAGP